MSLKVGSGIQRVVALRKVFILGTPEIIAPKLTWALDKDT